MAARPIAHVSSGMDCLPQLMAFEACVRLGSVTRAAEELSLAQPTVSCCCASSPTISAARRAAARPAAWSASPLGALC
jgi:hypothetical protein